MEGKSQDASKNDSAQKSVGSSETLPQGVSRSGATPANTTPQVGGSSEQTTIMLSLESLKAILREVQPEADPNLLLARLGIVPTPPPVVDIPTLEIHDEETVSSKDKAGGREDVPVEQVEQPSLTPYEVTADLVEGDADVDRMDKDAESCVYKNEGSNPAEEVEEITDLTLETGEEKYPTEKAERNADPKSREKEVVNLTEDGERTKRANPIDEAARARAATVHIYRRRPAREEASVRQPTEEQLKEAPEVRTEGDVEGPVRSAMEPPCRRRRVLIDEEPEEEEEDVVFTLIDALPRSGHTDTPAEVFESVRERKRKGKAIAAPAKKKP